MCACEVAGSRGIASLERKTGTAAALPAAGAGWLRAEALDWGAIEPETRRWLAHDGSLTRALQSLCGARFRLRVLGQFQGAPPDVADDLFASTASVLVREVVLACGEHPWVFGQTVVPADTLARCPWIARLGGRSLGEALFGRPDVGRSALAFRRLEAGHALARRAWRLQHDPGSDRPGLWARRSLFSVGGPRLLVTEVFFPGVGRCVA